MARDFPLLAEMQFSEMELTPTPVHLDDECLVCDGAGYLDGPPSDDDTVQCAACGGTGNRMNHASDCPAWVNEPCACWLGRAA